MTEPTTSVAAGVISVAVVQEFYHGVYWDHFTLSAHDRRARVLLSCVLVLLFSQVCSLLSAGHCLPQCKCCVWVLAGTIMADIAVCCASVVVSGAAGPAVRQQLIHM